MRSRKDKSEDVNVWTSFTDAVLCFLIIVLIVFIANIFDLQRKKVELEIALNEKKELAKYAESALKDKRDLIDLLNQSPSLKQMVTKVGNDTIITFSENLTWQKDSQYRIQELDEDARKTIKSFGSMIKNNFLDHSDSKNNDLKKYETYSILIIGHANKKPASSNKKESDQYNYDLSKNRADAVRDYLYENVFNNPGDKNKYKILSSGVGVNHLIFNHDRINGDRCIEIAFKYDWLDMIQSTRNK